ncbi:glycosyltransferase [Nitratireductor sp.]|uniref:glycosyltransferase family 4 protein n=2 Tax=Phyllobacteriaceae TaxID=69277 RepID=UPI002616324E|nr:glycosyltransferase [Nitratireductor sp.]MCV0378920.1 glycosyltransferase [Nitratireductor sp.]
MMSFMADPHSATRPEVALKPRRVTFVVDIRGWAFDTIARSMQMRLAPLLDACDIVYWEDFDDPNALVRHINDGSADLVHFFFREHLDLILKTTAGHSDGFLAFCRRAFTTHIPDYLYSGSFELASRADLFNFIDGYFTTCRDLFDVYSRDPLVQTPDGVIFDWPAISTQPTLPLKTPGKGLRVLWSGNSKWGEYAGHVDYKGLETIINPALERVREQCPDVEFVCFDSARKKVPHQTILDALAKTDVLLIASEKEGTPLSLIEAMAKACAVVTTPVGIATDVLPEVQKPFICPRRSDAFAEALIQLCKNPDKLRQLQQANWNAFNVHFGPASTLLSQWVAFLNQAYERHQVQGVVRKQVLARAVAGSRRRRALVTVLRTGVRVAKPLGLVQVLNGISPKFAGTYNRVLHGGNQQGTPDYLRIGRAYQRLLDDWPDDQPLTIYAPMWKGVAASTEAMFGQQVVRYPYFDSEYPEVEGHAYLESLAKLLAEKQQVPVVYSGGSLLHRSLARRLHQINPAMRQFFMWHGSPAQWVEPGQAAHFEIWHEAYRDGVVQGMVTVKPGLHRSLERMGIQAWDVFNPIPDLPITARTGLHRESGVHIGLFSAISSWYKNPNVQLLAVAGRPDVVLNTNLHKGELGNLDLRLQAVNYHSHMPRANFLQLIAQQDLNLYVTNTECSPMIALESWASGVPCIVGPAGDVYSGVSSRLAEFLVEPRVDDPSAISDRIDLVLAHRDEISELLGRSREAYQRMFREKREQLLRALYEQ